MIQPQPPRSLLTALEVALTVAKELPDEYISAEHLLTGLAKDDISGSVPTVARTLASAGVTPETLIEALPQVRGSSWVTSANPEGAYKTLEKCDTDLTETTREGRLDPVIDRDAEIRRIVRVLSRYAENNPILIGEPGVGRAAVVEGLAQRVVAGDVPKSPRGKRLTFLGLSGMTTGAKYRGELEECPKTVLREIKDSDGEVITLIDEPYTIVGASDGSEGAIDAGSMPKPVLTHGELRMMDATTLDEYYENIERDPALGHRFQRVSVDEPGVEGTMAILHGIVPKYETHRQVTIPDSALVAITALSDRYITGRQLPDKTIDLVNEATSQLRMGLSSSPVEIDGLRHRVGRIRMEEAYLDESIEDVSKAGPVDIDRLECLCVELAGTSEELASLSARWKAEKAGHNKVGELCTVLDKMRIRAGLAEHEGNSGEAGRLRYGDMPALEHQTREVKTADDVVGQTVSEPVIAKKVGTPEIAEVVSSWTGILVGKLPQGGAEKLLTMEDVTGECLVGQKAAVTAVADAVRRSQAGISDLDRSTGSFPSLGPIGVGKTKLAKALARFLFNGECAIVHIDMSEYSEKHPMTRLVDASPGYVGCEEGGQLTEAVWRRSYSVVLLDETEKAHPEVFDTLLQVLNDGRLIGGQGRMVDFHNVIFVLASNLGSQLLIDPLTSPEEKYNEVMSVVQASFKPEFLSRLDDIITFEALSKEELGEIVKIQLTRITERLVDRHLSLEVTDAARSWLADESYDPVCGARPPHCPVQREIGDRLARMLLAREVLDGQKVVVDKVDGSEGLTLQAEGEVHLSSASLMASPV